jgi:HPt (histidine-containing phosphotransfer) domain-containing protein
VNEHGYAESSSPPSPPTVSEHHTSVMATIATQARRTNLIRVLELAATLDRLVQQPLDPADWAAAERTAHQLAGSAGTFGFHDVSALARSLERFLTETRTTGVVRPDQLARAKDQLSQAGERLAAGPELG